jgi:outer membrane protein, heavy metal efflux system
MYVMNPLRCCSILVILGLNTVALAQETLSLKQSVQVARTNNPFLKTSFYNIAIAETDIITARLRPNLSLNNQTLQLANSKYFARNSEAFNPYNRQVWWQLTKQFRLPAQRRYRIELAQNNVLLEQRIYAELERGLANDVSAQWLNTWIQQTKLELYKEAQKNIDSLVKINELRLKNLVITQTDLLRTKVIAEQYKLQIRTLTRSYLNELKRLKFMIGSKDSVALEVRDEMEPISFDKVPLDSLITYGLSHRTDIQTAQSEINVTQSDIQYQKSLAYPVPELGMIWNPQNTVPYVGIFGTVQIPIFSRNQGEIGRSVLARRQAEQHLSSLQLSFTTEITTSYQSYKTDQENLLRFQTILTQSETVLNSVRYAYLKGGTTIVDFLEAQRTWFETRQLYYDAVLTYRKSYIQLLFASGMINQLYQ